MLNFSLFGIPVRVEPLHWITLVIIGGLNLDPQTSFGIALLGVFVVAGFLSILIHELGHALVGRMFGSRGTFIVLQAMGGYAAYPDARFTQKQSFLATLAGPSFQLAAGAIAYSIRVFGGVTQPGLFHFLWFFQLVSVFWAIINLIPVLPLDGGRLVQTALGPKRQKLSFQISMVAAGLFAVFALTKGFMFGAVFLGYFGYQSFQAYQQLNYR